MTGNVKIKDDKKDDKKGAYDEVPYESYSYPQTHPNHLSTIATLFGLKSPSFKTARVLEIGCASGGNLAPLANNYPDAKFLGIDLSGEQIELANKRKEALNLNNLEFLEKNIMEMELKDKKDQFDYIICHGILSWVPENVRKKIFEVCNDFLSPNGVAVISYNALPGWNSVRSLREMMLYHTNRFENPADKVQQARGLLDFLAENVPANDAGYRAVIQGEVNLLTNINNSYLYHDHLEEENTQFYLKDFVAMARESGLDYLGDTNITTMYLGNMPAKVMESLKALDDVVAQEQYMDFITNRRFRSSIICKANNKIDRNLKKEQILNYHLTFNPAVQVIGFDPEKDITFKVGAVDFKTHEKVSGTLFMELASCGVKPIASKELIERTQKKLGLDKPDTVQEALINNALQLMLMGYINIHSDCPSYVTELSEKPVANPVARYEAESNINGNILTNMFCTSISSNIVSNIIIKNLDGEHTRDDILDILMESVDEGIVNISRENKPLTDKEQIKESMVKVLDESLAKMAGNAFLIA